MNVGCSKITRCGHVFCWPCILHYLSLGEHNVTTPCFAALLCCFPSLFVSLFLLCPSLLLCVQYRRCPLCFESIYRKALKSFVVQRQTKYKEGDTIEFVLVAREKAGVKTKRYVTPTPSSASSAAAANASGAASPSSAAHVIPAGMKYVSTLSLFTYFQVFFFFFFFSLPIS